MFFSKINNLVTESPLNRVARKTATNAIKDMSNDLRLCKHLNLNFVDDFNGKKIVRLLSSRLFDIASSILFIYEDGSERNGDSSDMVSVYKGSPAPVYAKTRESKETFCIAKVRQTKYGNTNYLTAVGSFEAGYTDRMIFKTMELADKYLADNFSDDMKARFNLKVVTSAY